jgi:hypothetical protein
VYKSTKVQGSGRNGVRPARGIAVVNGQRVRFERFSVEQNAFSAADSFTLELPFFVLDEQGDKILSNGPDFASQLMTVDVIPVQLYVGYPSGPDPNAIGTSDLELVLDGRMDTTQFAFSRMGETVTLFGRNAVGQLIDAKVYEKFPNLPASSIATRFAGEHGLTPVVTGTTALAGSYYNQQAAALGREATEWDLLLYLARRENYIVRVKGNELHFGPYGTVVGDAAPVPYTWGSDVEEINIERSPHAARNLVVTVLTYDRNSKKLIKEVAKSSTQAAQRIAQQIDRRAKYSLTYTIPGLTRQQAQNRAQQILDEYSRKQVIGRIVAAGNTALSVDRQIQIGGLGKGLDGSYYVNRVVHSFDLSRGYSIDASFSSQTDYTQAEDPQDSGIVSPAGFTSGSAIADLAAAQGGRVYWPNACAHAVNDVLKKAGVNLGLVNPYWVPDYTNVGSPVAAGHLQPGDLILTGWDGKTYGHIGIYGGHGQYWNVASHSRPAGYTWVLSPLPYCFQGRRISQ